MDQQFASDFVALKRRIGLLQAQQTEANKRQAARIANEFKALRHRIQPLLARRAEAAKRLAPRFDILSVLNRDALEETHSRILANLLDPFGSHDQGSLFLRRFIEEFGLYDKPSTLDYEAIQIEREYSVSEGRFDLLIRFPLSLVIVIENKIWSIEGVKQLNRYREWLEKQCEKNKVLIYLTPTVDDRSTLSARPDKRITYSDLSRWLTSCVPSVDRSSRLHGFLIAYIDRAKTIGARGMETNEQMQELIEFFLKEENLGTAYDVWLAFPEVLNKLQLTFWHESETIIQKRLLSDAVTGWKVTIDSDNDLLNSGYPSLYISPTEADDNELYLQFAIQSDDNTRQPYCGISYSETVPGGSPNQQMLQQIPEFRTIEEDVRRDGFKQDPWWLGWRYINGIDLHRKSGILQLAKDQSVELKAAENLLEIFYKYKSVVERINDALRSGRLSA